MKYLLLILILFNLIFLVGCVHDSVNKNRVDYTDEIFTLNAEKERWQIERKELTDKANKLIEKVKKGEVELTDAQLLFAEINLLKDKGSASVRNIDSAIRSMKDKAKEKSKETGVPWWGVLLMSLAGSAIQVKKRIALGLSEAGYTHS